MTLSDDLAAALPVPLHDGAVLRRYTLDDIDALWAAVEEERERIRIWMPWVEETRSIDDQRAWLESVVADRESVDGLAIFMGEEFVGGAGMSWDPFRIQGEIGYWVRSRHEGSGYITAATSALVRIGFEVVGLHRLVIRAGTENARSRAVPERLGFRHEGVQRGAGRGSLGFYDHAVYALLEEEWQGGAPASDGSGGAEQERGP